MLEKSKYSSAGGVADQRADYSEFHGDVFRDRAISATELAYAIAACDPEDACVIMSAALSDLSVGIPPVPFLSIQSEAAEWATFATRFELNTYLIAIFKNLPTSDQSSFLNFALKGSGNG